MCSNIQGHYDRGETFPCHYSRLNPWMVIEKFQRYESEVVRPQIVVKTYSAMAADLFCDGNYQKVSLT